MNVVSTSPSGTEILCALGVTPNAVSHACDYPPEVQSLPAIDASRITGASSRDRHERTEEARADGHVYDVDARRLRDANPDVIVTQEVCGVCAIDTTVVDDVLADLSIDPRIVGLNANHLSDVFECIEHVGEAVNREARAAEVISSLRSRLDRIEARTASLARPSVTVIEWMDPIHIAGNWVPELVEVAGGAYGIVARGQPSYEASWREVLDFDPDVLIVAPCSYSVARTHERLGELAGRDGWDGLAAVQSNMVFGLDGASYLTRWSPRLVDAAERLASILHPDVFGEPPADVVRLVEPSVSMS